MKRWSRSNYLKGARLYPPKQDREGEAHGLLALVGPRGSGKSLLAVRFAHRYSRRICGGRDCRRPGCEAGWAVYTNMRSTGSWASSIDDAVSAIKYKRELDHVVLLMDEIQQDADARRAMSNKNLALGYFMAQLRKRTVKVLATTQTFDALDSRLRGLTSRVFNCWTPDRGTNVYALEYRLATGHLPPWLRNNMRPDTVGFFTKDYQHLYDSWEYVQDIAFNQGPETILIRDPERNGLREVQVIELVERAVAELILEKYMDDASVEEVSQHISTQFQHDFNDDHVERMLRELGHRKRDDGRFQLVLPAAVAQKGTGQ